TRSASRHAGIAPPARRSSTMALSLSMPGKDRMLSRQREGHVRVARARPDLPAARGHDHVLPPADLVGARRGIARGGKRRLPKQPARPLVEGVHLLVA